MNADRAAELLQIPERGLDLLRRFDEEPNIQKAISAVQSGFAPSDVAQMYELEFESSDEDDEGEGNSEGPVFVYECQTARCKQKGRVATSSLPPDDENVRHLMVCPQCKKPMIYTMGVAHEDEIGHLRRTYSPRVKIADPLGRTDRGGDRPYEDVDD